MDDFLIKSSIYYRGFHIATFDYRRVHVSFFYFGVRMVMMLPWSLEFRSPDTKSQTMGLCNGHIISISLQDISDLRIIISLHNSNLGPHCINPWSCRTKRGDKTWNYMELHQVAAISSTSHTIQFSAGAWDCPHCRSTRTGRGEPCREDWIRLSSKLT